MPAFSSQPTCIVVTPVWNDSARLRHFAPSLATAFAQSNLPISWIIADDGSCPEEIIALHHLLPTITPIFPNTHLCLNPTHLGKGGTIRYAWQNHPSATFLAFLDADGSVSATDFVALLNHALSNHCSTLGVRRNSPSSPVKFSPIRALAHHAFRCVPRLTLGLRCSDPQCGAKIILANEYFAIADTLHQNGLAFDTELLITLQHAKASWSEIPVPWIETSGSKIHPLKDAIHMLRSVSQIRKNLSAIHPTRQDINT